MSDPMNRQADQPIPESLPRKSAAPLLWLLVLIALLAVAWYFYNRRALETQPATPPPAASVPAASTTPAATAPAPRTADRSVDRSQPRNAAGVDRDPQPIAQTQPTYPPEAFRNHEEGTVLVHVDVDAKGLPTRTGIARRSGSRELDRAAVDAVRKWQFKPALKNGKAVASAVEVPVEFKLERQ